MQMIRFALALLAVLALTGGVIDGRVTLAAAADSLYVGDAGDASVKRFDADTGASQDDFVKGSAAGLHSPRGVIFNSDGDLLVVDQNVDRSVAGEILLYSGATGKLLDRLVPHQDPDAPFAPRGMILWNDRILFVGNLQAQSKNPSPTPGTLSAYSQEGGLLATLTPDATVPPDQFHPTGVVLAPDGLLYVSNAPSYPSSGLPGQVLRFDPVALTFVDIFINSTGVTAGGAACQCVNDLHRPEGLVFGPDGKLYITSPLQQSAADTDKILIFNGTTGAYLDEINLYQVGDPRRAHALALLFGPHGKLFVPIAETGEVRRYDVSTKAYTSFVPAGGPLVNPWYLTFGSTDPATLAYPQ